MHPFLWAIETQLTLNRWKTIMLQIILLMRLQRHIPKKAILTKQSWFLL